MRPPFYCCKEREKIMTLDPELLKILACPDCKTRVYLNGDSIQCTNAECRRCYSVTDDIPVMLVEESTVLSPEEWKAAMEKDPGETP